MSDILTDLRALCDDSVRVNSPTRGPLGKIATDKVRAILDRIPADSVLVALTPDDVECIEVFADGSVSLLGDHSQDVMHNVLGAIGQRAREARHGE